MVLSTSTKGTCATAAPHSSGSELSTAPTSSPPAEPPAMLICPSVTVGGGIVQVTVMSMLWPSARYWKLKKLSGLVVQPRACIAPLSM